MEILSPKIKTLYLNEIFLFQLTKRRAKLYRNYLLALCENWATYKQTIQFCYG